CPGASDTLVPGPLHSRSGCGVPAARTGTACGTLSAGSSMRTRRAVALALVVACGPAGCGADASRPRGAARDALGAARRDSADIRILELSHTLAEVAAGGVPATAVGPDLRIGESDADWLGAPTDVASLGAGRFAVFDRTEKAILLFDSAGVPAGRLGREGGAPGEYHEPLALAAVGNHLVSWQERQE